MTLSYLRAAALQSSDTFLAAQFLGMHLEEGGMQLTPLSLSAQQYDTHPDYPSTLTHKDIGISTVSLFLGTNTPSSVFLVSCTLSVSA